MITTVTRETEPHADGREEAVPARGGPGGVEEVGLRAARVVVHGELLQLGALGLRSLCGVRGFCRRLRSGGIISRRLSAARVRRERHGGVCEEAAAV